MSATGSAAGAAPGGGGRALPVEVPAVAFELRRDARKEGAAWAELVGEVLRQMIAAETPGAPLRQAEA